MVVDCAPLSSEPRMKALGSSFVDAWKADANILGKMVDPAMPTNAASDQELQSLAEYQRWILHGAAPNDVALSPQERDGMFSPDNYRTGKATHQLFALCFYRKSKGSTPELDRLMQKIEERTAWEAAIDFRVADLYLQRLAFLLAAGRPRFDPSPMGRKSLCCATDRRWLARNLARLVSNALPLLFWRRIADRPLHRARNVDLLHAEVPLSGMDREELQMNRPSLAVRSAIPAPAGRRSPGARPMVCSSQRAAEHLLAQAER
jgi:hypothetical protein